MTHGAACVWLHWWLHWHSVRSAFRSSSGHYIYTSCCVLLALLGRTVELLELL